jgi:cytochrome c-type biogenesis protein CcmH
VTATDAVPVGGTDRPGGRSSVSASARRRGRGRLVGWLVLLVVLAGALVYGATDSVGRRTPDQRARDLAESVACPTCDGQAVADSDAEASKAIREFIEARIAEGQSDGQIRDELAASFGEHLLLEPGRSGVSSLVWALPVAGLVVALAGLALAFRRWRDDGVEQATEADRALVEQARARAAGRSTDGVETAAPGTDASGGEAAAGDPVPAGGDESGRS